MRRRALVTGATGGLGRTLVPMLLDADYKVVASGRNIAAGRVLAQQGAKFIPADLSVDDPRVLVDGAQVAFHLAARSSPWGSRADFDAINVAATARLIDATRAEGCERFVHASTPSIYAERRARLGLTERSPVARHFANAYAATKHDAEQLVLAANCSAMRTVVLRPRAIVGPEDRVLLPRLLRVVRSGRVPLPAGGEALVELTDVRDAATAFLAADRSSAAAGRAINISGGQPRTVRAIVEAICRALDLTPRIFTVSTMAALWAARLAELSASLSGREPALTRYAVTAMAFTQTFDLSLALELLGWQPRITPEAAIHNALANRQAPCAS